MIRAAYLLPFLALACLAAGEAELPPHQGTVVLPDRSFTKVWIISETVDGVKHTLGAEKDSGDATEPRGKYLRVEYEPPQDVPYIKAVNAQKAGDLAAAATLFAEAAKGGKTWYTRHNALLLGSDCLLKLGKADEAMKTLDALLAAFPKTIEQARVAALRAQILAKKGDAAGALKAYTDLAKRADWGVEALALGSFGQAELLNADKKFAEAATVLSAAFAKLDPDRNPDLVGKVGAELAKAQAAAGQTEPALATLRRLAYGAPDATGRAQAQLQWAQMLMAGGDIKSLSAAFDHAAIVALSRDADPAVVNQGATLIRQISGKIDKLPADQCSDADKAEYRRYLQR